MAEPDPDPQPAPRRPGELLFTLCLLAASLFLLWSATGIENPFGPNGLSSPRAIPMAATAVMVITAAIALGHSLRRPRNRLETIRGDILPRVVLIFLPLLVGYGILLRPLGFLPVSALFLSLAIKLLSGRGWLWVLSVALSSLLVIWLVFRILFSVLIPAGIIPEAEIIQFFRNLIQSGPTP